MIERPSNFWYDAAESGGVGLWRVEGNDRVSITPTFALQLGQRPQTVREWLVAVHPEDRAELHASLRHASQAPAAIDVTYRPLGSTPERWLRLTGTARATHGTLELTGTQTDVTDVKSREARLRRGAFHDPLTGLANRVLFLEHLADTLTGVHAGVTHAGVLFLDLNGFKRVNDAYGHALGDVLIACVATRLQETLGRTATIARYGGDEFTVLLEHADESTLQEAARRVHTAFAAPLDLGLHHIHVHFSIGGVLLGNHHAGPAQALEHADRAMYAAKREGRAATRLYDSALHHERRDASVLTQALATALRRDELEARYAPLHLDGRLVGAEVHALLPAYEHAHLPSVARGTPSALTLDRWLLTLVARETHAPGLVRLSLSPHTIEEPDTLALILTAERAVRAGGGTLQLVLPAAKWDAHARTTLAALRARSVEIVLKDIADLSLGALAQIPADSVLLEGPQSPLARAIAAELGWSIERAEAIGPGLTRDAFLQHSLLP